jgi:hypothetical protein
LPSTTESSAASGVAPRVVFGLLVLATVAAFFVTQRLKRSDPVVRNISLPVFVSPNGDHRKDRAKIAFKLPKADHVTVSIVNAGGDEVRRLADRHLRRGKHYFVWNGRDGSGVVPPDGFYYLRVVLGGQNRGTITRRGVRLVTKPPAARLLSVTPARVSTGGGRAAAPVTIRFSGPSNPPPIFSVFRTDLPGRPKRVAHFLGTRGSTTGTWDGRVGGRRAPAGTYAFAVVARNRAYVRGTSPRRLPPTPARAAPRTGVTIAGPAAAPPLEPVRAGSVARVGLVGASGRVRWSLTALGARKPLRRGRAGASVTLRVGVPSRARTGVYVLRVSTRSAGSTTAPLAVRGRTTGRVLVVLPAIAWQGLNPVDDDADGFPDTLDDARSVPLGRPFASGRPPAGFGSDVAPLLRFLDGRRLRYDLTTDVALAHRRGPRLGRARPGVVFAGSERWFTEPLDSELRDYVEAGGRVASFGTDSFRRTVAVTATALSAPGPAQETNALGEQTAAAGSAAAPLVVGPDALGLFAGTDNFVGLFTRFEQSEGRVQGAAVQSSAGRDPAKPAFVAYKLGSGLVVRVGTPQWSAALASDSEVGTVTEALWSLLSR